jgi:hypothetical protein
LGKKHILDILLNDNPKIDEFEKERVKSFALTALDEVRFADI